uniref:Uncharacterized protein n=1 Tax=viral metagenome TaxID=1070528 RepID=A0A6M3JBH7_9ZZZZ
MNGTVKDLAVAGEYVYFIVGEVYLANNISRYQAYNAAGTWTTRTVEEELKGNTLQLIDMPDGTQKLFVGSGPIGEGINVRWGIVPPAWGNLIHGEIGRLVSTTSPWDATVIANVTVTSDKSTQGDVLKLVVAAGFTTGLLAVQNVGAVDISHGKHLGMLVKSSVGLSAGDVTIVLSGQANTIDFFVPSMVFHQDGATQTDMPKVYDTNPEAAATKETVTVTTDDYIYVGHTSEIINKISVALGSTVNAVASVLTVEYYNGQAWTAVANLADGTAVTGVTLAKDGVIHFDPPYNVEMVTVNSMACYWLRLKVSVNLTAAVEINEIHLQREDNVEIDLPALGADTWTWCYLDIDPQTWPPIDWTTAPATVASVGLYSTTDFGAATILVSDVKIYQGDYPHLALPGNAIINGMEAYNDSATSPQVNPWIFTLGGVYEIQMVSGGYALVRLPLREMVELMDVDSGRAHTTNGVYLFFNLGEHLERYYNRQLDDVGPDRDAGLPEERRGPPRALASYPGKVLIAIDAGDDGVSSVLAYKDGAIYEIYRAPRAGDRIRAISHQSIPGSTTGRLWISMGVDMIWVPMSTNPEQSEDYRYCHESVLQTGRIYADLQDVEKFWKSIKLVTEDLAAGVTIACDYRTSGSTWTEISDVFDTSPLQEIDIVTDYSVSGRWIELRFRIETSDNQVTPVLMGIVIEGLTRIPVKFAYTLTFRAADRDHDLQGEFDPVTGYAKVDQMDTWVASPLPLLLNSWSNYEDGMYVFPEPSPVRFIKKFKDEDGREARVCQTTLIGI